MPEIPESRRKIESAFMNDLWGFRKAYWEPVDTDEYWAEVVQKIGEIADKYKHDKYVKEVLLLVVCDLEFRMREKTGEDTKRFATIHLLNRWRKDEGLAPVEVKRA